MNDGLQRHLPADVAANWIALRELPKGGQAHPIAVQRRSDGVEGDFKRLREPGDRESRARLAREISIPAA